MVKGGDNKKKYSTYIRDIIVILVGCIPYACSIIVINNINMVPGGGIGIATIVSIAFGTPIGLGNVLINVPIIIMGTFSFGKKFFIYTGVALVGTSTLIDCMLSILGSKIVMNSFEATVWGGILMGVGSGMILYTGASLAGTTVVAKLLVNKFKRIRLGNMLIILDGLIVCCGALLVRDVWALLYSALYTLICTKVIDLFLYTLPRMREKVTRKYLKERSSLI